MKTFKVGEKVIIKHGKGPASGTPAGSAIYVNRTNCGSHTVRMEGSNGLWNAFDYEVFSTVLTVKDLEKSIAHLNKEIAEQNSKLEWLKESGFKEYDANQHKIWLTLNTLENEKLSKIEKVKLIASLVNA